MIKYLTYYYGAQTIPFRSLSALPDEEAIKIMNELYVDDPVWGRFKNPAWYIQARRQIEQWLRHEFISKGGRPQEDYPIYMVVGACDMLENAAPDGQLAKIQVPISYFKEEDVSFTYIDSMFSYHLGQEKLPDYYQEQYHGKVFTLSEILSIIEERGEPVEGWWGNLPADFFPYIEAQVWNHKILRDFLEKDK